MWILTTLDALPVQLNFFFYLLQILTSSCVHSCGAEGLPHNGLADVGSDEERDPRTETVSFLQQLVQQQHNQASHKQLHDKTHAVS